MSELIKSSDKLDIILGIVENNILDTDDGSINSFSAQNSFDTSELKLLINELLLDYKTLNFKSHNIINKKIAQISTKKSNGVPRSITGKLNLLKSLLKSRIDLSPQISPIFSAGKKPRAKDVDQIIEKLISQGMLQSNKKIKVKKQK